MIKYFQKAFKITNENIILTTPLVFFLLLFSIYLGISQNAPANIISAILLLITILFMVSAFFAGWFFMVKRAIDLDKQEFIIDEDRAKASFNLIKEIPVGIGEYVLPFAGALILYTGLLFLLLFIGYQIGLHFIGNPGLNLNEMRSVTHSPDALKTFASSLSPEQLAKLKLWDFLFMGIMSVYYFITMFWPAQIIIKTKNPLVAFFKSLIFTFKNFISALILFVYISVINFIISLIVSYSTIKPITSFVTMLAYLVSMLLYFYFVVYVIVLIFLYYDSEASEKTKNNCDSGTDSIGQEQLCDTDSESD